MDATNKSEIAMFRNNLAIVEEGAQRGLYGYAQVATHESITARAERGAERILRLVDEGKHDEARRLMDTRDWGLEEDVTAVITQEGEQTNV